MSPSMEIISMAYSLKNLYLGLEFRKKMYYYRRRRTLRNDVKVLALNDSLANKSIIWTHMMILVHVSTF